MPLVLLALIFPAELHSVACMRWLFGPIVVHLFCISLAVAESADIEGALRDLKDPNVSSDGRLAALHELKFSLDPRIPEAVLPVLQDEGSSVRAWAARTVGSRWWQIPRERAGDFVKALRKISESEELRESSMGLRGIGLLQRDYGSSSFARSPDKRWVIYERFSCPCLLDTRNLTEELLGCQPDDDGDGESRGCGFSPIYNRSTVSESVFWHPGSKMVACSTGFTRYGAGILIWRHGKGVVDLESADAGEVLRAAGFDLSDGSFWLDAKGWRGDVLEFEGMFPDGSPFDSCRLGWDSRTGKINIISAVPAAGAQMGQ
mgnify:CR=1 FL=1